MIRIIIHPLSPRIFTVSRDGRLMVAVNGTDVVGLHRVFRKLVVKRRVQNVKV